MSGRSSLRSFVNRFLYKWIVLRETGSMKDFLSAKDINSELKSLGFAVSDSQQDTPISYAIKWTDTFLTLWLLEDHSTANKLNHALDPMYAAELLENSSIQEQKKLEFASVWDAIEWEESSNYEIVQLTEGNQLTGSLSEYAVVFRFVHIPRDSLIIIIRGNPTHWTITRLLGVVFG
jgi:hypothetical protein